MACGYALIFTWACHCCEHFSWYYKDGVLSCSFGFGVLAVFCLIRFARYMNSFETWPDEFPDFFKPLRCYCVFSWARTVHNWTSRFNQSYLERVLGPVWLIPLNWRLSKADLTCSNLFNWGSLFFFIYCRTQHKGKEAPVHATWL